MSLAVKVGWARTLEWSRVILGEVTVSQMIKKFSVFYRPLQFVTVLTVGGQWALSSIRRIQSKLEHPVSLRSTVILSSE
jgi:hypothetical protein